LRAFRALLRPGGKLAVHEYSVRDSLLATALWNLVCWAIIIPSGRLRSGDSTLYKYLRRSVNRFDGAEDFRDRLRRNGFTVVRSDTMPGWQRNIVHTFLAEAPR
jgi:ubiquinone/menaquinone biosynthesis C-methylase UbiE